jgi:hypothetical protein
LALVRASAGNDVAAHQFGEALVQRLHADVVLPVWMAEYICATLFSRIRLRMAGCRS